MVDATVALAREKSMVDDRTSSQGGLTCTFADYNGFFVCHDRVLVPACGDKPFGRDNRLWPNFSPFKIVNTYGAFGSITKEDRDHFRRHQRQP